MNIKRGMDRIALVLAAIAILPGGILGWIVYEQEKKGGVRVEPVPGDYVTPELQYMGPPDIEHTPLPDFKSDKPSHLYVLKKFRQEYPEYNDMPDGELVERLHAKYYSDMSFKDFCQHVGFTPTPKWQCAIAGATGAGIAFLLVLFGVRGTTRLALWIGGGFKDKKTQ